MPDILIEWGPRTASVHFFNVMKMHLRNSYCAKEAQSFLAHTGLRKVTWLELKTNAL